MKYLLVLTLLLRISIPSISQDRMTAEILWSLGRVSGNGVTKDGKNVVFTVSTPNIENNKSVRKSYLIPIAGGNAKPIPDSNNYILNDKISPDGRWVLTVEDVKMQKVYGKDVYPDLPESNAHIYDELNYRHWDEWEDGAYSHIFISPLNKPSQKKDIMAGQPYDSPQKPFGGEEDYIWSPDNKVIYVTKPLKGTAYAQSTNTDIFSYDPSNGTTTNLTAGMMGYDVYPQFSKTGVLAWLSMPRDGYEADKQDIWVSTGLGNKNITRHWDGSVESFKWDSRSNQIFFIAATDGTLQLFTVDNPGATMMVPEVKQITRGDFDIVSIVGQEGNTLIVSRTDMNHAAELFTVDLLTGNMKQLTHVNDHIYSKIKMSPIKRRYVTTSDDRKMLVWMIYPPDFDSTRQYPTLLYCQGGPQSPLTQFYSYRWNFQLMAANGYIIVAPNRRGMYGHGQDWNEAISKDWGGQVMKDYLSAIDDAAKLPPVDKQRLGCVGASYGGYSAFYLAGIHNNRFKTFIAHDGVFDLRSMSGTTEELWFTNWEFGGNFWERDNKSAQKTFGDFNPVNNVDNWNTPIYIIQGGKDYRVPIEQGLAAFQAAQLKGIKSRLLYLPDENHWVLKPQNALVWQREFFRWLKETL